mmetsp:Transcript_10295/g.38248  ORF Transcript_10295/g.38248 Transcript_10295/m.38248 type:complete len:82 (-) Transcript_10295:2983-3228(-)
MAQLRIFTKKEIRLNPEKLCSSVKSIEGCAKQLCELVVEHLFWIFKIHSRTTYYRVIEMVCSNPYTIIVGGKSCVRRLKLS